MALTCKIGGVQYTALDLMSVQVGLPDIKTQSESVPGADGEIDLTDALTGGPVFGNRQIKLRFCFAPTGDFEFYSFAAAVHGRRLKLELSNKAGYYIGRCTVGAPDTSLDKTTFDVTIDADPYLLEPTETTITIPVLAASSNLMVGKTLTVGGSSSSYAHVSGSGADTELTVWAGDDPSIENWVRVQLPWPTAGSCIVTAEATQGWYEITDADGNVYNSGSRWCGDVPANGLYVTMHARGGPVDQNGYLRRIQIYKATPTSLAFLASERLLYPAVGGVTADTTIMRCSRPSAPVELRAGETVSPYLSIRREQDYGFAVAATAGQITLTGRRGWM